MQTSLSSLAPDEDRPLAGLPLEDLQALLALLSARLEDPFHGSDHWILSVEVMGDGSFARFSNTLRVPKTATADEIIGWARLMKKR